MRLTRLLAALLCALVLLLPSAVAVSSAQAAGKPHRVFTFAKIVKLHNGSLSFRAHIAKYPDGVVALMKKTCPSCAWSRAAVRRTTASGRIVMPVPAPAQGRWYWRYRTPKTPTFAVTYSATWFTYRK
jgi:hypothetical protein